MRKILTLALVVSLFAFTACQNDDVTIADESGNISGMGDADGELQVTNYNLPEGMEIVGNISGVLETSGIAQQSQLKSSSFHSYYGSGGRYIKVKCVLKNNVNRRRTVFFPPGLIFKVHNQDYQHAILLCWTWMCFDPSQEREIVLDLYCINKGRTISLVNSSFEILGVTNSNVLKKLLALCNLRKINIEHYTVLNNKTGLKATVSYDEITENLQNAVWALTNGTGLTVEQEEFINSLPLLEDSQLPPNISNLDFEPPYYWEEYTE